MNTCSINMAATNNNIKISNTVIGSTNKDATELLKTSRVRTRSYN